MPEAQIVSGYIPGAIGRVAEMHGTYYGREYNFGLFFEAKVASELCDFLRRYDPEVDGFWSAVVDGDIEGSITIDGLDSKTEGAHLRWFVVSDALRGQGAGNLLLQTAMDFCRARGYRKVYLDTFEGLDAARHLYEKHGFRLVAQQSGTRWGSATSQQRFEVELG